MDTDDLTRFVVRVGGVVGVLAVRVVVHGILSTPTEPIDIVPSCRLGDDGAIQLPIFNRLIGGARRVRPDDRLETGRIYVIVFAVPDDDEFSVLGRVVELVRSRMHREQRYAVLNI